MKNKIDSTYTPDPKELVSKVMQRIDQTEISRWKFRMRIYITLVIIAIIGLIINFEYIKIHLSNIDVYPIPEIIILIILCIICILSIKQVLSCKNKAKKYNEDLLTRRSQDSSIE